MSPVSTLQQQSRPFLGIGMKVGSVVAFMGMATAIKYAGQIPAGQIVFFRSFFAILPICIYLLAVGELRGAWRTSRPLGHVMRGLVGVSAMSLGFYGLTRLPLPDSTALGYARPLVTVILGALLLGEVVRRYRWGAVISACSACWSSPGRSCSCFAVRGFGGDEALGVLATLFPPVSPDWPWYWCAVCLIPRRPRPSCSISRLPLRSSR
jgi:hypothetical protein